MREIAQAVYGAAFASIKQYVDILLDDGITRGVIGPREADRIWDRHILNSAALSDLLPDGSVVADVGSGAGLPGIPIAILRPDLRMTLIEPLLRRATFLTECVDALSLSDRVTVVRSRAEDHRERYEVVLSRAVAPLPRLIGWCWPLCRPGGIILALKGRSAAAEAADATSTLDQWGLWAEVLSVTAHVESESATVVRVRPVGRRNAPPR